jgi:hypothetical protein
LNTSTPTGRKAFSRVELLVVVLIFFSALGLLIVYIARQRGRAERVHCMKNLMLIGQGVQSFHDAQKDLRERGFLPPARIADGYATWTVLLIPHVAPGNPAKDWDVALPFSEQDEKLRRSPAAIYLCPARQRDSLFSDDGALGDYAGAAGDGAQDQDWTGPKANGSIILGEVLERKGDRLVRWRGRVGFEDLERGVSNTLVIGEKHVPSMAHGQAQFGDGSIYDGRFPANTSRVGGPAHPLARSPAEPFQHNFGSSHVGLCQFLAADGSVRPLDNDIAPPLLGRLIVRHAP